MSALTIRRAAPDERSRLLDLLLESFGDPSGHWSEDYWRWKHEDNPFGPSYLLVAEDGGRPVGLRVFLRWELQSGDRTVPAVRAVDTATHPDYRRRGIFSRLTREALDLAAADGTAFVFNTPNDRSRPGYLRLGWQVVGRVPLLVKPLRPGRLLFPGSGDAVPPSLEAFPSVGDLLASPDLTDLEPEALAWRDGRLHTERSRRYLTWRYARIPNPRYHALWAREGGAFAALLFRGRLRRRRREVSVAEVLWTGDPEGPRLARRLLRELTRDADADYVVAGAATNTAERAVLRRAGFLPVPGLGLGPRLTVRTVRPDASPVSPYTWSSWRCSIGDLEIF